MSQGTLQQAQRRNGTSVDARLDRNTVVAAVLIFLAMFALYFLSRSPGLDEFDSANLVMGIRQFNLWDHQPHPPGYPLFIFFGWVATKFLGLTPQLSLHVISALGGALFMSAWFLIIRSQFNARLAWWVTACLAVMPGVWLTATKILTDSLAAGFLGFEIFAAIYFWQHRNLVALWAAALCGAAAAGSRPQLIPIVIMILATGLKLRKASWKTWLLAMGLLVAGCLAWLLPMWYMQARLRPDIPAWLAYPKLAWGQWEWRLDKPHTFLGAGNWSVKYLATRFAQHFLLGWFGLGFGFLWSVPTLVIGIILVTCGFGAYLISSRDERDRRFWKFHAAWSLAYIGIIFVCLDGTPRYYILIFPLLLVVLIKGLLRLRVPWKWSAVALPILFLYIAIPNVIRNHRDPSPPTRMVRYLMHLYPPAKRKDVALLLHHAGRHARWYAPQFRIFRDMPSVNELPQAVQGAAAVYTDDPNLPLPAGWHRVPLAVFQRSIIIYDKHHFMELFLIDRKS